LAQAAAVEGLPALHILVRAVDLTMHQALSDHGAR
jgi:hypothetical protein